LGTGETDLSRAEEARGRQAGRRKSEQWRAAGVAEMERDHATQHGSQQKCNIKLLFFRTCVGMVSGVPDDLLLLAVFHLKK
jgi:hypothetical protein